MPNRILKESVCFSDSIDQLSWFEEVLFYRLIVNCDDFGRFDGRPAIIKNRLFPLKENITLKSVSSGINTLASAGLVTLYEFEGKPYLYLPTWNDHQNVRAKRSKYPEPVSGCKHMNTNEIICKQMNTNESICSRNPIQSESLSESLSESVSEYGSGNPDAPARDASEPPRKKYGQFVALNIREFGALLNEYGHTEFARRVKLVDIAENEGKDFYTLIRKVKGE